MSVSGEKAFEVAVLAEHWWLRKIKDEVFAQFFSEVVLSWYSVRYSAAS